MNKNHPTRSYAASKAGNQPNKAAFFAGLGADQTKKAREKYARALMGGSGKRVGVLKALQLHTEAERAIPAPMRLKGSKRAVMPARRVARRAKQAGYTAGIRK